jgi:thiol-disulfide isomerase/thioredoxin
MRLNALYVLIVGCLAISTAAHAQWQRLDVGGTAPSLSLQTVHGKTVSSIESGNVYVIGFWATWCVPCKRAIPLLSELQQRYESEGLIIIGVSDEEKATVERFVQRDRDRFAYTVAVDSNKSTWNSWMGAANRSTIPTAFIVDREQRIQYIGSPLSAEFDEVLVQVIHGRYDARLMRQAKPLIDAIDSARRMRNWRMCFKHIDDLLELNDRVFALHALKKFEIMIVDMSDKDAAYRYGREMLTQFAGDPALLVMLAEKIATDPKIADEDRDLSLALEATRVAERAAHPNQPRLYSVQAMVNFHMGNVDEAISLQRRAWRIAPTDRKPSYEIALRSYQEAQARMSRRSE